MSSIIGDVPKLDFECKPSQHSLLRRANLHGFAALPDELFLEILSYLPPRPIIASAPLRRLRRTTLRSLSEVCQNMRRVFRPCLWQRVEEYVSFQTVTCERQKPKKDIVKELLRQLNVVTIQDPHLAQYVRIVDIQINSATFRSIFDELGRCFSLLPNLHTVKIVTKSSQESKKETATTAAKRCFKKSVPFPQIRSAILSSSVYPLLAVCPNLESLTILEVFLPEFFKELTTLQKISWPVNRKSRWQRELAFPEDDIDYQSRQCTKELIKTIRLLFPPNIRTWDLRAPYSKWPREWTEIYKAAILNIPLRDRQNLREVIFSGDASLYNQEKETFLLPEF